MFFFFTPPPPSSLTNFGQGLAKLERALQLAQDTYPQMTVGMLHTLLHVGRNQQRIWYGRISVAELANELNLPPTSLARQADTLGEGSGNSPGLGLLERAIDETSRKVRILTLTKKGERLLKKLEAIIDE
jgi:DNA-binding MarR family transcriptional regulator